MRATVPSADGVEVHYEVHGTGAPPLVFVHGWSCDRGYWRAQVGPFAAAHRVVTLDLAGHGDSGDGRSAYTMRSFGADVAAVLDRLDLRGAVLVGHSMGGDVAIEAAQCSPGRVAAVVWVDVYRTLGEPDDDAAVEAFVAPFRTDLAAATRDLVRRLAGPAADPDLVEAVAADMAAAPPAVALDALGHSFRNEGPVVAALPGIGVPVTAIVPADRGYDAASLARHGVTTVPMAGVGHFVMLEDPDRFNRVLAGVLGTTVA